MADPGFPIGGDVDLVGGAWTPEAVYILKILYVETKESGPLRAACAGYAPLDPPMLIYAPESGQKQ